MKQRQRNRLAVESWALPKPLQAALEGDALPSQGSCPSEFQESHRQCSPPPFHRYKHTGGFLGSADRGILGPVLSLQAEVEGSGRTRTQESSGKKQKAEERMNPEDSKATTRKG